MKSEWLLCGTSFLSDLEWRAIGLARQEGKRCVVMLDHWVNYRHRFMHHGQWHWPDEIWVGDKYAARIARKELPHLKQTFVPNPYFMDIQDEIKTISRLPRVPGSGLNILYVCEPQRNDGLAVHGDERYWGYTEEEALSFFLSNIHALGAKFNQVAVRPHPKEQPNKYDWVKTQFDLPLICGEKKTLLEQIADSDIVAGCTTMAMVVALLAGKRVISCTPPGSKAMPLPFSEIEDMCNIMQSSQT